MMNFSLHLLPKICPPIKLLNTLINNIEIFCAQFNNFELFSFLKINLSRILNCAFIYSKLSTNEWSFLAKNCTKVAPRRQVTICGALFN